MKTHDHFSKRCFMSVLGVTVSGMSVGLFRRAMFGVDPFQSFMSGLNTAIPISFGFLYVIVNAFLLLFSLVFDRHYIGIATVINLFLLGYVVQFSSSFLFSVFPDPKLFHRLLFLLTGVIVLSFSSAFYITADLGVSTYDALALIIVNTWHKGKFRYVRIITDFFCVILGSFLFLLGEKSFKSLTTVVGLGTIITAFFMGPLTDFFCIHIARPFLDSRCKSIDPVSK